MGSGVDGGTKGCSGTLGVTVGGGIAGGGDEPGAGSQPPGNPGRRVGDLARVVIESE